MGLRIVFIAGTWEPMEVADISSISKPWRNLKAALSEEFPDATYSFYGSFFWPWQTEIMRKLGELVLSQEDYEGEVLLVAHSMGGIFACGIAPLFKKARVRGIVTIFTPHTMGKYLPFLDFYRQIYGGVSDPGVPVLSFGGLLDVLVPFFCTRHPNSVRHVNLWSDHRFLPSFVLTIARRVAREIASQFGACDEK